MLRIYLVVLALVSELRPVLVRLRACDRSLEDQLRQAMCSVALNLREGDGLHDGNRRLRYRTALGSLNEAEAALQISVARGYIESIDQPAAARFRHLRAVLVRLTHGP